MAEPSISQILESESYKHQKEVVNRAINKNVHPTQIQGTWYSPARLADPRRVLSVDIKTFQKTDKERGELITLKKQFKKQMRAKFPNWEKRKSTKPEYLSVNVKNIW
jgi:hypothetical protein